MMVPILPNNYCIQFEPLLLVCMPLLHGYLANLRQGGVCTTRQ